MRFTWKPVVSLAVLGLAAATAASASAAQLVPNVSPSARPSWQVMAPGWTASNPQLGRVDDVLRVGNKVFLAGNFTQMANHKGTVRVRQHVAAVSPAGALLSKFKPNVNGRVYSLAASPNGKFLFIGGDFTSVNGQPRSKLAAFSVRTGKLVSRLPNLNINGDVRVVKVTPSGVYLGGSFSKVGSKSRGHLAKLVLTRKLHYLVGNWAPKASAIVRALVIDRRSGRAMIGGDFTTMNGQKYPYLASVAAKNGKILKWAHKATAPILDLARAGRALYAAEGGPGGTALAYNIQGGSLRWYYMTDGNLQAVTTIDYYPVWGMHGDYVAPARNQKLSEYGSSKRVMRHKLFMLTPKGKLMGWNPNLISGAGVLGVWGLSSRHGSIYVGGDFTGVHGKPQQRFAILQGR